MNEYEVTFACLDKGRFAVDIHRSSGTSRYAQFDSISGVRAFFASIGLHEDRLTEVETTCSNLRLGEAYHETMTLPESVMAQFDRLTSDAAA